jgi:hypothetical protein
MFCYAIFFALVATLAMLFFAMLFYALLASATQPLLLLLSCMCSPTNQKITCKATAGFKQRLYKVFSGMPSPSLLL